MKLFFANLVINSGILPKVFSKQPVKGDLLKSVRYLTSI